MFNKVKNILIKKYCNELGIQNKQLTEENKRLIEENNYLRLSNSDLHEQLDSALYIIYSNRKKIRALLGQLEEFKG